MKDDLPNDATGDALRRFAELGWDLGRPIDVDFFVQVPSESAGDLVAKEVRMLGFNVTVEKNSKIDGWTCYCTKSLIVNYEDVVLVEAELDAIGRKYGGHADGFGSYGNT